MTEEEKYYLDSLITNALSITNDEKEGQQVIDLENLNICAVDYSKSDIVDDFTANGEIGNYSDDSDISILNKIYTDPDFIKLITTPPEDLPSVIDDISIDNNVIIEFSDATIKDPNPLQYTLSVKPGDNIDEQTIMGTVMQDGRMKTLKSIFKQGTVVGNEDNTDFYRLYPSRCNRHIILKNVHPGNGSDFDITIPIQEVCDKFKNEAELYALITNNLCQSLLPVVLSHRYRGVYTRKKYLHGYSKWYLDTSDLSYDKLDISTFVKNKDFQGNKQYDTSLFIFDTVNESLATGVAIFDTSVMLVLHDILDEFGSSIISPDITKDDMKSWRKRAKKKRKRKKVKKEIKEKTQKQTDTIKHSESPYDTIQNEALRLLDARQTYIDKVLDLYNNRNNLPLCKFDPEYNDCKFLVNDKIDENVLKNALSFDDEFTYSGIGDTDNYYNYYTSLLANINLLGGEDDKYSKEYYDLITDIINKRLIVESIEPKDMMLNFMKLFNDNVSKIFNISDSVENLMRQFNSFEMKVNTYVKEQQDLYAKKINEDFDSLELGDEAKENAGGLYSENNKYKQIYDYINSLYTFDKDEDDEGPNEIISQLSTMYMYIKSYGDGKNNIYKDMEVDNEYLYLGLVNEEAKKITDFWDKVIAIYLQSTMDNCMNSLNELAHRFDEIAQWPLPNDITINNTVYQHYLFENIYPKDIDSSVDIEIGDYDFPDEITIPDLIDPSTFEYPLSEQDALDLMNSLEQLEPDDPDVITFLDFKYWKKYFALATLICLVPSFWNCGLDIFPFIQLIPLPCIFTALSCVYIPIFNMLIVFGIAIRGMYPWPIILYLNTSDQPISILTPLVAILDQLKNAFNNKLEKIEYMPIQTIVNTYVKKLNDEINDIKRENIKLDNFIKVIKSMKFPKAESVKRQFASIVDPSIDMRQRIYRIEQLSKNRVIKSNAIL